MGWHTSHCLLVKTGLSVSPCPAYLSNAPEYEPIPGRRYGSTHGHLPRTRHPPIKSTRILDGTLASALVMFGIVLVTVLPGGDYPATA